MIIHGDCLIKLKKLPDNSVDSCVTDPPYELGFMGKSWDGSGIANNVDMWREVLRVLKPGGHLLSFSGTRTYHRQAVAIEDAGFEIRDMVEWVYGSGFPKSTNVSIRIDKEAGLQKARGVGTSFARKDMGNKILENGKEVEKYIGKSELARKWEGWGTALKPAHEPICLARKPIEGTVAQNVLKYGTGGINIDKSRVGFESGDEPQNFGNPTQNFGGTEKKNKEWEHNNAGRFPANLIHDGSDEVVSEFPNTKSGNLSAGHKRGKTEFYGGGTIQGNYGGDEGSASRFFKSFKEDYENSNTQKAESEVLSGDRVETNDTVLSGGVSVQKEGAEQVFEIDGRTLSVFNGKGVPLLTPEQAKSYLGEYKNNDGIGETRLSSDVERTHEVSNMCKSVPSSIFYCPKASKSERDRGCEELPAKARQTLSDGIGGQPNQQIENNHNNHPTVKPLALMKYLIQMITPEGGVVLDPFAGSGSTLVAAKELGYDFIGIEMTEEYIPIIEARLKATRRQETLC